MIRAAIIIIVVVLVLLLLITLIFRRPKVGSVVGVSTEETPSPSPEVIYGGGDETVNPTPIATPSPSVYSKRVSFHTGAYLTDPSGRSLYVYDREGGGESRCEGDCIKTWIPYTPGPTSPQELPDNVSIIQRGDGTSQYAWYGRPLYYYARDQKPGDILGSDVNTNWHPAPP